MRLKSILRALGDIALGMGAFLGAMSFVAAIVLIAAGVRDMLIASCALLSAAALCSMLGGYVAARNARSARAVAFGLSGLTCVAVTVAGGWYMLLFGAALLPSTLLGALLWERRRSGVGNGPIVRWGIAVLLEVGFLIAMGIVGSRELGNPNIQAVRELEFTEDEVNAPADPQQPEPITLVKNADGTIQRRAPKAGEGIVGLMWTPPAQSADGPATPEQLAARAQYQPASFERLKSTDGQEARKLTELTAWANTKPSREVIADVGASTSRAQIRAWLKRLPPSESFSFENEALKHAADGVAAEQALSLLMQLPPAINPGTQSKVDEQRERAWNGAQVHYAFCSGIESDLKLFCTQRLDVLKSLY